MKLYIGANTKVTVTGDTQLPVLTIDTSTKYVELSYPGGHGRVVFPLGAGGIHHG